VANVLLKDLLLNAPKRRPYSCDLRDDVNAVAIFVYHAGETANLTLDPIEALQASRLVGGVHS
jgi:hypothetical protein